VIDTNALRKKVLDLAIRGKLVPQNPNDEPASVLLERIREEKQRLIREGKIKKDKVDSVIFRGDDNCHYEKIGDTVKKIDLELPNGWEFCRLSLVCWLNNGEKSSGEKLPYLDARTLRGKNDKTYLDNGIIVTEGEKVILVDGENSGEVFIVPYRGYMGSTFKILQMVSNINVEFIKIILDYYKDILKESKTGAAIPHLNKQLLKSIIIGVPPIDEQNRIVSQVQQIMQYIDLLENNQNDYANLVETLKKAVLQSAIQGTLVEQDEADEPASILLGRIREEKRKQLGKKYIESYIYKGDDNRYYEKNGSETQEITEEIPFDIPQSWEWCRASNCILPMESQKPQGVFFQYIDIDAIDNKKQMVRMPKTLETSKAPSRASRKVHEGDTLFSMVRPYLKNIAFIDESLKDCIASTGFYVCQPDKMLYPRYLFLILISSYFIDGVMEFMKGDNSPSIRTENLENMLLPIPPLREQERIVNVYNSIILSIKDEG